MLKSLLDALPYSDGAMSEGLGTFYSDLLHKHPRTFIRAIAGRPRKERYELCMAAGETDGSGMYDSMLRDVRMSLRRIAAGRNNGLAPVARAFQLLHDVLVERLRARLRVLRDLVPALEPLELE